MKPNIENNLLKRKIDFEIFNNILFLSNEVKIHSIEILRGGLITNNKNRFRGINFFDNNILKA